MLAPTVIFILSTLFTFTLGKGTYVNSAITIGKPQNCQDVIQKGKTYEGHYVIYPETHNIASLIYCSQDDGMEPLPSDSNRKLARNCLELLQDGETSSGPQVIFPYFNHPAEPLLVFCDQETDGGGWVVIQRRFDGSEDFYRGWDDYSVGFGSVDQEHWLGNTNIAALTAQDVNEMKVDVEDWNGVTAYAHYLSFSIDADDDFKLNVTSYDGTAGDALMYDDNGFPFSTFDKDNTNDHCPEVAHSGGWFGDYYCGRANLNGRYYPSEDCFEYVDHIGWATFADACSLKESQMMVRPHSIDSVFTATGGH